MLAKLRPAKWVPARATESAMPSAVVPTFRRKRRRVIREAARRTPLSTAVVAPEPAMTSCPPSIRNPSLQAHACVPVDLRWVRRTLAKVRFAWLANAQLRTAGLLRACARFAVACRRSSRTEWR